MSIRALRALQAPKARRAPRDPKAPMAPKVPMALKALKAPQALAVLQVLPRVHPALLRPQAWQIQLVLWALRPLRNPRIRTCHLPRTHR